jgi:hypothetical protein
MRVLLIGVCSALAVISGALGAPAASAQTADPQFATPAELQEREFFNGAEPTNPAYERKLPIVPRYRSYLPPSVDLSNTMPPVGDQGRSQSCSAWSIAYAARSYYTRALEGRRTDLPANVASPSYVFHLARQGDWGCVEGTNIARVVEVLRHGALSLADYPFASACRAPASAAQIARAKDFRVKSFERVDVGNVEDLKGQLSKHHPVIMRFHDTVAFQRHRGSGTFSESLDNPKAVAVGWHSFTLVGYDEKRQAFRLINSWGTKWGENGYAWISYDTLLARSSHAYVLQVEAPGRPVASREPSEPRRSIGSDNLAPASTRERGPQLSDLDLLSCAKLATAKDGERQIISGFVSSAADLDRVKAIAASAPNIGVGDVSVMPWPRCELMLTLEKPLAADDRPKVSPGRPAAVTAPGEQRYLYVSLIKPDGSVSHLLQPEAGSPQTTPAGTTVPLTSTAKGVLVALASTTPLFEKPLAPNQSDRDYLSALRRALLHDDADRNVSSAVEVIGDPAPQGSSAR